MNKIILLLSVFVFSVQLSSCSSSVSIQAEQNIINADDGYPIVTYELISDVPGSNKIPRAIFFYIQGSEFESVINKTGMLASSVILGGKMIVSEKRGVSHNSINKDECYKYDTKECRVNDNLKVIKEYLKRFPSDIPVILIGGSEGGDIASVIASMENRISYLILIGSGGGISQEAELKLLSKTGRADFGNGYTTILDTLFDEIKNSIDDSKIWAGHPYRRWKSYLNDSSASYLEKTTLPVLILHGEKDNSVPVESARELYAFLNSKGKQNIKYIEYKNTDHSFKDINTGLSIYPKMEIDMVEWLYQYKLINREELNLFKERIQAAHKELFNK